MGNTSTTLEIENKRSQTINSELHSPLKSEHPLKASRKTDNSGSLRSLGRDDATVNTCTTRGTQLTYDTIQSSRNADIRHSEDFSAYNSISYHQDLEEDDRRYKLELKFKEQQRCTRELLNGTKNIEATALHDEPDIVQGVVDTDAEIGLSHIVEDILVDEFTPNVSFSIISQSEMMNETTHYHAVDEVETNMDPLSSEKIDSGDEEVMSLAESYRQDVLSASNYISDDNEVSDDHRSDSNLDQEYTEGNEKPFFTLLQLSQMTSSERWKNVWDQDDEDDSDEEDSVVTTKRLDEELQLGSHGVTWERTQQPSSSPDANEKRSTFSCISSNAVIQSFDAPIYEKPSLDAFEQLRVLGKGSFGKVLLVRKCIGSERGGLFAMKRLRKTHLLKRGQIARTRTERLVLSMVDHPFIMKLHFAFQTEEMLYLVLDYCAGGELFFHLCREKKFPEQWTRFYAAELLLALGHLHSKGIIYRDLKPENVLLDSEGHVKLGDFGLAKTSITHYYKGASSRVGTPEYMAPEVLLQQGHGFCVDYWGLGMLTYEMMTGLPPWYTTDRHKLIKQLKYAPLVIPPSFSPHVTHFVSSLLVRDPRQRLGARGIQYAINHEFFRRLDFKALQSRQIVAPIRPCEGWQPIVQLKKTKFRNVFQGSRSSNEAMQSVSCEELEQATANFDRQFTRMALDSSASRDFSEYDTGSENDDEVQELNVDTFIGFTYDDESDHVIQ